jgi:hypothetical protein
VNYEENKTKLKQKKVCWIVAHSLTPSLFVISSVRQHQHGYRANFSYLGQSLKFQERRRAMPYGMWRFRGTYGLHLQGRRAGQTNNARSKESGPAEDARQNQREGLMMEEVLSSETSANFYRTTRHYIPEDTPRLFAVKFWWLGAGFSTRSLGFNPR